MDRLLDNLINMAKSREELELRQSLPPVLKSMRSVYGGFIGERFSQDSPVEVWEALHRMGITQIIDLRYKYYSEKFTSRCKEYGIRYYNYPIHNDAETIANMVENYSSLTELLCNGEFYMMGLHTSYVALSLYWTFSKCPGLYPYELRKEVKHNSKIMERVIPILYAMNKYSDERYGDDPNMPTDYYEYEKEQIKDFIENDGPKKVSYSIVDFTRAYRNDAIVYDVSVEGMGIVGYLCVPKHECGLWEYDLVLYPFVSGKARSFEEAQIDIVKILCDIMPRSTKWDVLPKSMKMCISLLRDLHR